MVKCTVIETSGLRQGGICDLCDHHCERDLEGMGGRKFPCTDQSGGCTFTSGPTTSSRLNLTRDG